MMKHGAGVDSSGVAGPVRHRPIGRNFVGAVLFAAVFCGIPWPTIMSRLPGTSMVDRSNYLRQIAQDQLTVDYRTFDGPIELFTYEFLWGWTLRGLANLGVPGEQILNGVAFLAVLAASLFILQNAPAAMLLVLANPLFISLVFSQSRIAFMLTILAAALLCRKRLRLLQVALVFAALLIHTSAPLFVFLYSCCTFPVQQPRAMRGALLPVVSGAVVSAATGPLMGRILTLFGDRRADYSDMSSGLMFLAFWALCLILVLLVWHEVGDDKSVRLALAIFSLATFSIVFDSYASRFLAALFPVIIVALFRLSTVGPRGPVVMTALIGYVALLWIYAAIA